MLDIKYVKKLKPLCTVLRNMNGTAALNKSFLDYNVYYASGGGISAMVGGIDGMWNKAYPINFGLKITKPNYLKKWRVSEMFLWSWPELRLEPKLQLKLIDDIVIIPCFYRYGDFVKRGYTHTHTHTQNHIQISTSLSVFHLGFSYLLIFDWLIFALNFCIFVHVIFVPSNSWRFQSHIC